MQYKGVGFCNALSNSSVIFRSFYIGQSDNKKDTTKKEEDENWTLNGTGFAIDKRGYIATNHHVIADNKKRLYKEEDIRVRFNVVIGDDNDKDTMDIYYKVKCVV
jgi:S1-C subfamily serine protease